jgi:peptide deformylase
MIATTEWKEEKEKKGKEGKEKVHRRIIGEYVMINPKIIEHSEQKQINEEACLSLPGLFGNVERFAWIKVKYFDPLGKEHTKKLQGFNAVIIQHEIDHLKGVLFVDKVIGEIKQG